jgi:leucyl-tRNA synthetase
LLPDVEKYEPSPEGHSPLANVPDFVNVTLASNLTGKRETNTMPQWAGSCWYYLRFMDPHNTKALVGKEAVSYWGSVDEYVGGAEHAVLHLLYARFWHKVLFDLGVVDFPEPFHRLQNQGMILAYAYEKANGALVAVDLVEEIGGKYIHKETKEELKQIVAKMSKSLKNVVNPNDVCAEYGVDTFRLYEMSIGDFRDAAPWDTRAIIGVRRFLERVCATLIDGEGKKASKDDTAMRLLHKTIKKVGEDIVVYKFNTALSALNILLNEGVPSDPKLASEWSSAFVRILHPFAPHIAEEIWEKFGNTTSISCASWPVFDPAMTVDEEFTIAVQVLGKLRATFTVARTADQAAIITLAKALPELQKWIEGKEIIKEIYVPGKIVNFVLR